MANPSYDIEGVCEGIKKIDDCLPIGISTGSVCYNGDILTDHCPKKTESAMKQCDTNKDTISAGLIWLLITFENLCDPSSFVSEMGQYGEYAILWLSYKIQQYENIETTTLKDFYTNHIETNSHYNDKINYSDETYKTFINKKINSMNMSIKEISNFYEALKILCKMYNEIEDVTKNCEKYSKDAKDFVNKFKNLNNDSSNTEGSSHRALLSTLSNDYDNLKNNYGKNKSCNFPDLPAIKTPQLSAQSSGKYSVQNMGQPSYSIEEMCKFFETIWKDFPDTLGNDGNYNFDRDKICETYCGTNCYNYCEDDNDKIMTGFVSLFKKLHEFNLIQNDEQSNMNIGEYIIIWLIYMLKLKDSNTIMDLNETYDNYVNQNGGHSLVSGYSEDYSSIINNLINNTKYLMNLNKDTISKFYNLLKLLCSMYNDININPADCTQHYKKAKTFGDEYQKLLNSNDTNDSSHTTLLSSLSTDYDNFKSYCNEKCNGSSIPSLPTTKTTQVSVETSTPSHVQNNPHLSLQGSEVTSSSSSIASKLIPALLIFAIPIFLGIAYKYSLFGFDKQLQRQYLREKIKKITKKMNNYI
ncbi:hypothetical protein YYE_04410 [Plasmodium vinckei vinckei]|uniref:PIR protein CIR protein n=1 Tax=Plasmodium vinckei vinckei TaxID=54757 RepID=A0A081IA73_PLAVN|nr:hypothetical protein YYE_04410 [Plasmodium vinckei vinckei]